ncbi:hypothetical protein [Endozoicomonas sp. ALB115]|uniref:hypothetical protein n=1 Tax=Endozoicomonas sp. ALB115 TaxID=3403074 RepID=UPI003BB78F2D
MKPKSARDALFITFNWKTKYKDRTNLLSARQISSIIWEEHDMVRFADDVEHLAIKVGMILSSEKWTPKIGKKSPRYMMP